MKINLSTFVVGFLFALGLGLSGMTRPEKIVGFLNIFGNWDPSLIFVMVGSIMVHFVTYKWIRKKEAPWFATKWNVPTRKDITPALVIGGMIFGIGWGLGGYCPGPAVTSLASLQLRPLVFVASMIIGMYLFGVVDKKIKFRK